MSTPPATEEEQPSVATRTLRGALWAYGGLAGARVLTLVSTAILARLLAPKDFGLVALALVFIAFADTVSDVGLGEALVISPDREVYARAETVFAATVGVNLLLAALCAASGPLLADFFHQPRLVAVMPVFGLNFILRGLGATHYALAQKAIDFRSRTAAEIADVAVRGFAGISMALAGLGAWSLVLGYIAGSAAMTVVLWATVHWRPKFLPRRSHLRPMLSFGGRLTIVGLLAALMQQVDYVFVGRILGATALGFYTLAYRLPELLILSLSMVAAQVLFPAFASIDADRLREVFPKTVRYSTMLGLPLAVGMVILAKPIVLTLYGDKWHAAASAMQVLATYSLLTPVSIIAGAAYKATGRADILLRISVPQALVLVGALAVFTTHGIVAVAACQAVVRVVFTIISVAVALRLIRGSARELVASVSAPVAAAAGLALVLLGVDATVHTPVAALAIGATLGGITYLALLWVLARDSVGELWRTALPRSKRFAAPPTGAAPRTGSPA